MKGVLLCIALCVLGTHAVPKPVIKREPLRGRIGGNEAAESAPHACMVLVHRVALNGTGTAALGGASIISNRHVVTAAHLVQGDNIRYQIGFVVGTSRRLVESNFRLIHEQYNATNFLNDIALLFLQGTATFPLANVIIISTDEAQPAAGDQAVAVGFGFTAANSTGASSNPYAAAQAVANECQFDTFNTTDSHFCAIDEGGSTWVCPGDNGAGLFTQGATEDEPNRLVGIVSRVLTGCAEPQLTGYTRVSLFTDWITNVTGIPVPTFISNYKLLHKL